MFDFTLPRWSYWQQHLAFARDHQFFENIDFKRKSFKPSFLKRKVCVGHIVGFGVLKG